MRRSILLLPICLVIVALAGCGNKGPLVLPTPATAASTTAAPAMASSSAMPTTDPQP